VTRYVPDGSTSQTGRTIVGGSPLKLFRLSPAGAELARRVLAGDDVPPGPPHDALLDRLLDAGAIHPRPDGAPLIAADVTVVIPAHGAEYSDLQRLVAAGRDTAQVVVVDDGSRPPIGPIDGADVIRHDRNRGPGAARNTGLAAVHTALVAFVDTDVELDDGWMNPLLAHFGDERVALVAPRVASTGGPARLARYEQRHSPLDLGPEAARIAPGTRVSYVPAAALVVRADALRAVGGFDETLRFGEDVDAVWRLVAAGWRARYEPGAVVHHRARPTWRALALQRIGYGRSAAPLARRHPGALAPVRVSGWSAGVWALAVAGQPLVAIAVGAGTAGALVRKLPDLPAGMTLRLAGRGHLYAGRLLADAVRRAWWPAAAGASLVSRRARRATALAAMLALADGGPVRLLDDLSYGVGLWLGVIAERESGPLVPDLRSWPGRVGDRSETGQPGRYRRPP
jgi:mycofactocin system glycosyltransferase